MKQFYLVDKPSEREYNLTQMIKLKIDSGEEPLLKLGRRSNKHSVDIVLGCGISEEGLSPISKSLLTVSREHATIKFTEEGFRLFSDKITHISYEDSDTFGQESTPEGASYILKNRGILMFGELLYGPITLSSRECS